ncbi:MAG: hypothetical protein COY78_03965 [Candidatus Omnitrophica bacterium CG_4_10_14_0_8_um_filter_44_12]|nr:MAG: hypothetical protein COY78_03965 [Candidatus Omnitrophica bacterium CG_4_10_14_0_8_um_filter_44_12]
MKSKYLPQNKSYETTELKLAALLLSEIPGSTFEVYAQGNSIKKAIKVTYLTEHEQEVNRVIRDFIERQARVDVYKYNHNLNSLRDRLKKE